MIKLIHRASVFKNGAWKVVRFLGWFTRHNGMSRPLFPVGFTHNEGGDAGWSWSFLVNPFRWRFHFMCFPPRDKHNWYINLINQSGVKSGFFVKKDLTESESVVRSSRS